MGRSYADRLAAQEARTKIAELKVREKQAAAAIQSENRLAAISMKYDAITRPTRGTGVRSKTETKDERGTHTQVEWFRGIASARDLERNFAGTKSLLRQKRTLVVRYGPKLSVRTDNTDFNEQATGFFNEDWAKNCDSRNDLHFGDFVGLALTAAYREGHLLLAFDDIIRNDGGLFAWEADQICNVESAAWDAFWRAKVRPLLRPDSGDPTQAGGVVRDQFGRVLGYIVTQARGRVEVPADKATFLPRWHARWNPAGVARLFSLPWRVNQDLGTPDVLAIANEQWDIYEMKRAELASAKAAGRRVGFIETGPDSELGSIRALQKAGLTSDELGRVLDGQGTDTEQAEVKALIERALGNRYENLEQELGGLLEYGDPGDKLVMNQHTRPAASIREWADNAQEISGAALGLARSRSTMRAESSYTAFRGEELMTWEGAEAEQKALERGLADFCATKAIAWAMRQGIVTAAPPANWDRRLVWRWPVMREVDESKAETAKDLRLKGGRTDWSQLLGPDWEKTHEALAEQANKARQRELPLGFLEMKSGGAAPSNEETEA